MSTGNPLLKHLPGQMHGDIATTDITVAGTATSLPASPLQDRKYVYVWNGSGDTIYLGGESVTIHDGVPLADSAGLGFQLGRAGLYATNAATASGVRVIEIA